MLGNAEHKLVPILSQRKITDWLVSQEVIGFEINTQTMRIKTPGRKLEGIKEVLKLWPRNWPAATAREMWSSTGKLRQLSTVVPIGRCFVLRLLLTASLDEKKVLIANWKQYREVLIEGSDWGESFVLIGICGNRQHTNRSLQMVFSCIRQFLNMRNEIR